MRNEVKSYCVRCRKQTPTQDPHVVKTANGRYRLVGTCPYCGTQKSQFVSSQKASGLLSMLGIKTPLANIPLLGPLLF